MPKSNAWIFIVAILSILIVGMFIQKSWSPFAITGSETMTRTAPSQVNPGQTFTATYTASGVIGSWGASIIDTASGGCSFPAGTQLKTVMLSDEGATKQVQVTAPQSGSCTFTGDYKFGECSIKNFQTTTVSIGTSCIPKTCSDIGKTCGSWNNGCGGTINCGSSCGGEEEESGWCKFAENIDFIDFTEDECKNGTIFSVIIAGIIFFIFLLRKK